MTVAHRKARREAHAWASRIGACLEECRRFRAIAAGALIFAADNVLTI
jgi:type IV secretory pathway TrbF-like protein